MVKIKNLRLSFIVTLAILLTITGCKESFLEVDIYGLLYEENMATKKGLDGILLGAYRSLQLQNDYWVNCNNSAFSSFGTNEWVKGNFKNPQIAIYEQHAIEATANPINDGRWMRCYHGIQRANSILNVMKNLNEDELTDKEISQLKGEAIFIRGVLHFELAKIYLNVPYINEDINFNSGNYKVPNTQPIWSNIEADFKFAADNLAETHEDRGRANSWAAKIFLAKVYMQQDKYAEALPLFTDAIENGVTTGGQKYELNEIYHDNYDPKTKNSAESVFAVQFSVFSAVGDENRGFMVHHPRIPGVTPGNGFVGISRATINTFKTDPETGLPLLDTYNDFDLPDNTYLSDDELFIPYGGTLDSRLDLVATRRGIPCLDYGMPTSAWCLDKVVQSPYMMKKYLFYKADVGVYTRGVGWTQLSSDNYDMIRFADVLLLAAECEVEAGSLAKGEEYVNRVRSRAANPATWVKTYVNPDNPTAGFTDTPAANYKVGLYTGQFTAIGKEYARKAYRFERRLELCFEGHYFFDLQRWDNGSGYMADQINATIQHELLQPIEHAPTLRDAIFIKGKHELYPIPQAQINISSIDGNPTLIQNPGY